ncbi:LytTR family DNA-binding domain-containing protein [Brevundimonas sp. UBA5866]|nr:LytTR family DNA-binding domain-containing protein [Brevundimonas sp. UBA5866]
MRARLDSRRLALELMCVAGAVVVLALLQPLGILGEQTVGTRLFYWARSVGVGYLLHRPLLWLGARLALRAGLPEWAGWIAGLILACVSMSLWLWYFGPRIDPGRAFPSEALWADTAGQVLLISSLIALCLWFIEDLKAASRPRSSAAPSPAVSPAARPAILARTPWPLSQLVALEGEDHYVRVHTDYGSHLVLMRMADAIAETRPVEGMSIHRSWWVAKDMVRTAEAKGRNLTLHLHTDLCATVARSRVALVRQWLDRI